MVLIGHALNTGLASGPASTSVPDAAAADDAVGRGTNPPRRSAPPRTPFRRAFAVGAAAVAVSLALVLSPTTASAATIPVAAPAVAPAPIVAPLVRATQSTRLAAIDRDLLAYVNQARTAHHLAPLVEVKGLDAIAHTWSTHLAQGPMVATFAHNPNLESMVVSRMPAVHTYGENIASFSSGRFTAYAILKAYLASPGHRANILSPNFRYVGIVTHDGAAGMSYNAMNFAG